MDRQGRAVKPRCNLAHRTAHHALKHRVRALRSHVRAAAAHDLEGIHDLRVASRRLRAVLGDYADLFRKRALKPFRKRVRSITRGLGKARELDVTLALLRKLRRRAPKSTHPAISRAARMLRELRAAESEPVDASCALARSPEFRAEHQALLHAIKRPKRCYLRTAEATLRRRYAALVAAHRKWIGRPSDETLHRVRVAFKKLRYSCEIAENVYGQPMEDFIGQMKNAQELLGDWNDTRVLRDYLVLCSQKIASMTGTFAELERICDADAQTLLDNFARSAPELFNDAAQSAAVTLFASPQTSCCNSRRARTAATQR